MLGLQARVAGRCSRPLVEGHGRDLRSCLYSTYPHAWAQLSFLQPAVENSGGGTANAMALLSWHGPCVNCPVLPMKLLGCLQLQPDPPAHICAGPVHRSESRHRRSHQNGMPSIQVLYHLFWGNSRCAMMWTGRYGQRGFTGPT